MDEYYHCSSFQILSILHNETTYSLLILIQFGNDGPVVWILERFKFSWGFFCQYLYSWENWATEKRRIVVYLFYISTNFTTLFE